MSERPFLEMLKPPDNRWFARGLWVTHDLNTATIVELVLPALAGLDVAELEARRGAWGSVADDCLMVACAADRASYRAPVPVDVVEILAVAGRRLHAKFLILQYDAEPGMRLARTLSRVIVTSSNLTRGGLTSNREVWALHEITSRDGGKPSVARDLLDATEAMARELPVGERVALLRRTRDLRAHLPHLVRAKTLRHSLTAKAQADLLAGVPRPRRVVIVSPPFATGSASQTLHALSPVLHNKLRLDIYVGTNLSATALREGANVPFLPSLASELAKRCEFRLYAVPGLVGQGADEIRRILHAKVVLAFFDGEPPRIWVGSANLTGRGLGGRNRELLLEVDPGSAKEAQAFVNALAGVVKVDLDRLLDPLVEGELPIDVAAAPPLRCVFRPQPGSHAGQTFVAGTLVLEGDLDRVRRLWARDDRLRVVSEQGVSLAMDAPWVRAVFVGSSKEVELLVSIDADGEFWEPARLDADDDGRLPRDLRLLLSDLVRAKKSRKSGPKPPDGEPGRFDLPYDRRLPNVVRMLRRLAVFDDADLKQRLAEYLDDQVERDVALDLLASIRGSVNAKDPAVRALQRLMAGG